jgi:hypothetical protein
MEKINLILDWAVKNTAIDTTLVDSCKDFYFNHGYLTEEQELYLDKFISKFRIS